MQSVTVMKVWGEQISTGIDASVRLFPSQLFSIYIIHYFVDFSTKSSRMARRNSARERINDKIAAKQPDRLLAVSPSYLNEFFHYV